MATSDVRKANVKKKKKKKTHNGKNNFLKPQKFLQF